jgi:hypothetical protein
MTKFSCWDGLYSIYVDIYMTLGRHGALHHRAIGDDSRRILKVSASPPLFKIPVGLGAACYALEYGQLLQMSGGIWKRDC